MLDVFFKVPGEDQDVIKIHKHRAAEEVSEDIIYKGLEDGGSVGKTKGHNKVFEISKGGVKCCLPLVSPQDVDQVVGLVQLGEDGGGTDQRERVFVFNSDLV